MSRQDGWWQGQQDLVADGCKQIGAETGMEDWPLGTSRGPLEGA